MPLGSPTITAAPGTQTLRDALVARLDLTDPAEPRAADILVCTGAPQQTASHVIVAGPLTDDIDAWDTGVPAQTLAGALWLVPGQPDPEAAAAAWLLMRLLSPATPLSDLTDTHDRALRWSVVAATEVTAESPDTPDVDPAQVRAWVDAQAGVQELGAALERLGGDTAAAALATADRFRTAVQALDLPPAPDLSAFDAALAEHLRQVQRTGFARWRGAKARAASAAALGTAATDLAAERVQRLLSAREDEERAASAAAGAEQARTTLHARIAAALEGLTLPAQPDFGRVPRSWSTSAPAARRYVFVAEDAVSDVADLPATVRGSAQVPAGTALCALVQSGFSLPAVR